ncbi:translation elongation factor Ts [Candidatus Gracilibacteria bacterium]|nr:translation elongation factor Ts [Candidatus Gracilibacteria bacterium]MBF0913464.1 translation elongation factor Ts [Candidatus Gracilibacteria bacterium]RKW22760.1 MAG: translation elongation factor Ts [Candidatus Gracilibacteria bacterium]
MAITSEQIKKLREITGIGMMECKKALEEADGDMDAAIEVLRKKGLSKAAKKADRETFEGGIKIAVEGNKAYVVSVSCETDFLANSDKFKAMLDKVVEFLKEHGADSKSDAQEFINKNYALEMGENLQISNYEIIEGDLVASYVHSNSKLAALIVAKAGTDAEKAKQVAMHVTAASPEYLSPDEIPNDTIEREKSIQLEIMKNDPKMGNKTDDVLLKIIEGKIGKFKSEISLLEQEFVMDPSVKVKNFIGEGNIVSFKRYSI